MRSWWTPRRTKAAGRPSLPRPKRGGSLRTGRRRRRRRCRRDPIARLDRPPTDRLRRRGRPYSELLDPVVRPVRDVEVPQRIDRDVARAPELTGTAPGRSPHHQERAVARELLYAV